MAGFFGLFDYTKEGPGIPEDAPPKPRIVVFFSILARKFWKLIQINLLYGVFNIPAIILTFFLSTWLIQIIIPPDTLNQYIQENPEIIMSAFPLLLFLICVPVITVGPAQAGMTYLLRNYSREEHAFIWSDFKEHALKNFKQSLIVSVINTLITVLVILDIYLYFNMSRNNVLLSSASVLVIFAFILFMMMNMYIYPMIVTFDLTIKQLYKNALMFAMLKFFPNLLILIICLAVLLVPFFLQPAIAYLLFIFLTMSLIGFITNFHVYPKLKKYMMTDAEPEIQNDD